jgi:hypothetical protein
MGYNTVSPTRRRSFPQQQPARPAARTSKFGQIQEQNQALQVAYVMQQNEIQDLRVSNKVNLAVGVIFGAALGAIALYVGTSPAVLTPVTQFATAIPGYVSQIPGYVAQIPGIVSKYFTK